MGTVVTGLGPVLIASFNLLYCPKGPVFKCSPNGASELQTINFGGIKLNPYHYPFKVICCFHPVSKSIALDRVTLQHVINVLQYTDGTFISLLRALNTLYKKHLFFCEFRLQDSKKFSSTNAKKIIRNCASELIIMLLFNVYISIKGKGRKYAYGFM